MVRIRANSIMEIWTGYSGRAGELLSGTTLRSRRAPLMMLRPLFCLTRAVDCCSAASIMSPHRFLLLYKFTTPVSTHLSLSPPPPTLSKSPFGGV